MKKFKIVRYKGLGNWFVYRRYLIFFWGVSLMIIFVQQY